MLKKLKPGNVYMFINIDEPYAKEMFEILKKGQMAKKKKKGKDPWPEGDISFDEWLMRTWPGQFIEKGWSAFVLEEEVYAARSAQEAADWFNKTGDLEGDDLLVGEDFDLVELDKLRGWDAEDGQQLYKKLVKESPSEAAVFKTRHFVTCRREIESWLHHKNPSEPFVIWSTNV